MRITMCTMFMFVLFSSTGAWAQDTAEDVHRGVIFRLLDARNGFPTAKQFLGSGKAATTNRILAIIAANGKEKPRYRLNAIRALEYFNTPRTQGVLMQILYAKRQMPVFKRASMRALARAFGTKMYFELLPFLQDPDPRVRKGAATALGDIEDERIEGILANHLVHEKDLNVRTSLEQALHTIQERNRIRLEQRRKKLRPAPTRVKGDSKR